MIIRRTRSPEIRWGRDPPNDGTASGGAGVNSAADLGGQRCGNDEDRGEQQESDKPDANIIAHDATLAATSDGSRRAVRDRNECKDRT